MSALPENVLPFEPTGDTKISVTTILVTPDMARRWLASNTRNRKLKPREVDRFARDMAAGKWQLTGEGIKFSPEGLLLDGQNRLHACVKANTPFLTYVFRNVPDSAQKVMDTGAARTAADTLGITGQKHASILAAAARLGIIVEADGEGAGRIQPSHAEIEEWIEANPGIHFGAEVASRHARRTDCPPSVVAYTAFVLGKLNQQAAYDFWMSAAEKVDLRPGDAVIAMTNRFAEARRNRESLHKRAYLSVVYRAWNARRKGQPLRVIKINSPAGGLIPIPEPK